MATGRQTKRTFENDEGVTDAQLLPRIGADISEDEYNPELEQAFEQLKQDFRTANSDGTLWVHRVPLGDGGEVIANGKNVFLFSAPIQRYSTEEIYSKVQREFMADGMRLTCIRVSATKKGERGVRFNHLVMVEKPHASPEKQPSEASGVQMGSLGELVRVIQESHQATLAMLQRALQPHASPQHGMQPQIDNLRALAEIMFLLNGGGGARAQAQTPTVLDQLKTLRELRGFVGELADDAPAAPAKGGDGPVAVLKHLSPWAHVFGQLLTQQQQPARGVPRMPPHVAVQSMPQPSPQPAATVGASGQPGIAPMTPIHTQPQTEDAVLFQEFAGEIERLVRAAEAGGPAEQVAPMVLQMIPAGSEQEAALLAFLEHPQWWRNVCAIYPPARPHEAWFATLRATILGEFENDDGGAALNSAT